MQHKGLLMIAIGGAMALLAYAGVAQAAERRASIVSNADGSRPEKSRAQRRKRAADAGYTYGRSPPPYMDIRQTPGGPFDSGFFFDSGIGPHGGTSPYMH